MLRAVQVRITSPQHFHDRADLADFLHEASAGFTRDVAVTGVRNYVAQAILRTRPWPRCRLVLGDFYSLFTTPPLTAVTIYCVYCTYMELAGLGDDFRGSMAVRRLARRALYFDGFKRLQWKADVAARLTADWETGEMRWEEGGLPRQNLLLEKAECIVPLEADL